MTGDKCSYNRMNANQALKSCDMTLKTQSIKKQWTLLAVLTAGHFIMDCFPGMLHTLLPRIQRDFGFTHSAGATLLMVFLIASNGIQIVIGRLRPDKTAPRFLYLGFFCSLFLGGFLLLPAQVSSFWPAIVVLFICGAGIGMTHPEFLRSVHTLKSISSAVGTSIFMAGGVAGFAFGGWASTIMVEQSGFSSIWYFCVAAVVVGIALALMRVQLAREESPAAASPNLPKKAVSFWPVFLMAVLGGTSSSILVWAVPQTLDKMHFQLSFGGLSVMLFSLAGGLGGILVSRWAARTGELKMCFWMLTAGLPFAFAYPAFVHQRWACGLITAAGLLCYGAYPLMVSFTRQAGGKNLGSRMGWIVGGTWLIACMVPRLLAPAADTLGFKMILTIAPLGYLAAACLAGYLLVQSKGKD